MDRGDVLSGEAFSAVLRSAFVFVVVLVLFGWVTLLYVERSLIAELGDDVQERWNIIAAEHATEGKDHVIQAIKSVTNATPSGRVMTFPATTAPGSSDSGSICFTTRRSSFSGP